MPVKTTPSPSPRRAASRARRAPTSAAARTSGSVSTSGCSRSSSSARVAGSVLSASAMAAARRLPRSGELTMIAARSRPICCLSATSVSAASAWSSSGSRLSSGASRRTAIAASRSARSADMSFIDAMRGPDLAAQAVVVDDVFGVCRQRDARPAGGIDRLAAAHDEDAVAGDLHLVVDQRLQQFPRLRIAALHRGLDGGDALVAVADHDRTRLVGAQRERRRRKADERQQQQRSQQQERTRQGHGGKCGPRPLLDGVAAGRSGSGTQRLVSRGVRQGAGPDGSACEWRVPMSIMSSAASALSAPPR